MRPVATGLALGACPLTLGRLLQVLLFEIRASNPIVIASVVIILSAPSALACFAPARRATRVDPAVRVNLQNPRLIYSVVNDFLVRL